MVPLRRFLNVLWRNSRLLSVPEGSHPGVGSSLSKQFTCVFSGGEMNVYGNLDAKAFLSVLVAVNGQFPRALHVFA